MFCRFLVPGLFFLFVEGGGVGDRKRGGGESSRFSSWGKGSVVVVENGMVHFCGLDGCYNYYHRFLQRGLEQRLDRGMWLG